MEIVIAEDNQATREQLRTVLEKQGFKVLLAEDGDTAWNLLKGLNQPRLLLLDWQMPGLTGGDLCRQIRSQDGLGLSYIIIITANNSLTGMQDAFACGADDYIAKPFNIQELLLRVTVGLRVIEMQLELSARIERLRESEFKYRNIFENMVDAFYRLDAQTRLTVISPSVLKLCGYSDESDMLGRTLEQIFEISPHDAELFLKSINTFGAISNYPLKLRHSDGHAIEVETNARTIFDDHGNPRGVEGLFRDVTAQRQTENILRESREQYHQLFDMVSDALFLIAEHDGQILDANTAATKLYGYAKQELLALHNFDLSAEPEKTISATAEKLASIPLRWHRRKDGSVFPVELTATHFVWQGIQVHLAAIRDITVRLQMEDSLRAQNQSLEEAHRDLEQTNLDLIKSYAELKETQSRIMQQEKMISIGQLAAGMAHEINNPIGFIISNLNSFGKYVGRIKSFTEDCRAIVPEAVDAKIKEHRIAQILDDIDDLIEESLDGANRVKRLVLDLKSFSRVDEIEYKHADINECIESTLNIVWNELKYKAKVNKKFDELPQTKCYPQQLNQVFMNLLVNAAQAIEKQGEINIKTYQQNGDIMIEIADTGAGIPPDIKNRIFEPFFTTKEVGKGTGLGLSITYEIIHKHGGEIMVDSAIGQGTTFTVRIPIVEER